VPASPRPAPRAAATSEQDEQGAQELFQLGRQAMAAGNLVEACGLFARSNDLSPALGSLLNLADCEEKSGQIPEACQHWLEAAERARASNQGARSQVASDHARKLQCPGSGALGPPTRGPSRPFP
jgi:tetratricopeptide (TPR) repeat protein